MAHVATVQITEDTSKALSYFNANIADEGRPSNRHDVQWSGALKNIIAIRNSTNGIVWYVIVDDGDIIGAMTRDNYES